MNEKKTEELENILGSIHVSDFEEFCRENKESLINEQNEFGIYMKELFRKKGITQQLTFLKADIPERYGYKLLSGEKKTRQRDIILRICYAAEFTLEETQQALKKYEMPQLYVRAPRDAMLMILFRQRPGSIIDLNEILDQKGMEPLRTSGIHE